PLVPTGEPASLEVPPVEVQPSPPLHDDRLDDVIDLVGSAARGVVVAGGGDLSEVASLAEFIGWPLIAEPHSGARVPGALAAAQALLLDGFGLARAPDVVLHFGLSATSRATQAFVDSAETLVTVDPDAWVYDPSR